MSSKQSSPPLRTRVVLFSLCLQALSIAGPQLQAEAQSNAAVRPKPASNTAAQRGAERVPSGAKPASSVQEQAGDASPSDPAKSAASEASAQGTAEYRTLVEQALSEFKHMNWPESRLLFRRAHEINPNARTLRGIGLVSYEMREYAPAVVALTAALSDTRQALTQVQRKECEELLALARTFVASYVMRFEPAELELTVDGAAPSRDTDGHLLLSFGEHVLKASAPGYESSTLTLSVQGGERDPLAIALEPVGSQQEARLAVGEDRAAPAPSPSQTQQASVTPVDVPKRGLRYTWVALGASAGFGGAALASWYGAQVRFDDLKDQCRQSAALGTPCVRGELDTAKAERLERLTNAMLGLSAASLLTAAILMPFEWPRERPLAFGVGPRSVSLHGSF